MVGEPVTHRIQLVHDDGTTHTVEARSDQSILSVTDENDIELRHGCREGRCVSCTGLLLEGAVEYVVEPRALPERKRDEGFTLLCIAQPRADCRIEIGRSVLAGAFPRLWQSETHPDIEPLRKARRHLRMVDTTQVDRPDHLGGSLAPYENLLEVYEAYRAAGIIESDESDDES